MNKSSFGQRLAVAPDAELHVSPSARHTCRMCASGCRNYDIMLTEAETRRLSLNLWRPLLNNVPDDAPLVVFDTATGQYMLNKVDGRCVFLDSDNLCIIHKSSGIEAKPIVCQFFPLHAIQAPDGIHVSLNTGCRRLIEMNDHDAPLDGKDALPLLSQVEAITTISETLPLTPVQDITYEDFVVWQTRLMSILETATPDYGRQISKAAALMLTIPAEPPAPGVTWQTLFSSLEHLIGGLQPARPSLIALFDRARLWLPTLTDAQASLTLDASSNYAEFYASIARQYLEGRQVALHRSARTGWVALLAALVAGMVAATQLPSADGYPEHFVNNVLSDALELFFAPAGQIALTEPNQQAFLMALAESQQTS